MLSFLLQAFVGRENIQLVFTAFIGTFTTSLFLAFDLCRSSIQQEIGDNFKNCFTIMSWLFRIIV